MGLTEVSDGEIYAICTPNYLHVPQTIAALDRGKKIILEKPIATSVRDAEILLRHPLIDNVAVCYQRRFDTQAQEIKQYPSPIEKVDCQMFVRRDPNYWNTWRSDTTKSGGGALINIFIHYFDLLQWWLGKDYKITFAKSAKRDYIDQVFYANLEFNTAKVFFFGSAIHPERMNKITVSFKDGTSKHYITEDATHFNIYDEFLNKGNKISVGDALTSLKIVRDLYDFDLTNNT